MGPETLIPVHLTSERLSLRKGKLFPYQANLGEILLREKQMQTQLKQSSRPQRKFNFPLSAPSGQLKQSSDLSPRLIPVACEDPSAQKPDKK